MATPTRFTNPIAVDTWDAHFRWRAGEQLRDRTIDATWARVAGAAAAGPRADFWAQRYVDAFTDWRLLPDERLLRKAGTNSPVGRLVQPRATLNAGVFVLQSRGAPARFDHARFADTAALAVRFLDDAMLALNGTRSKSPLLRIGMLGLADALAAMGLCYDSDPGRREAVAIGASLAAGCLQGSVELARERGGLAGGPPREWGAIWKHRGIAPSLIDDATRGGLRYARLTAIESQPALALLSNDASDALDPPARKHSEQDVLTGPRTKSSQPCKCASLDAQIELRAAIQPMIDAPIDYPFTIDAAALDDAAIEACRCHARERGLGDPSFRQPPDVLRSMQGGRA